MKASNVTKFSIVLLLTGFILVGAVGFAGAAYGSGGSRSSGFGTIGVNSPVQSNGGLFGGGNIQNTPFTQAGDGSGLVGVNAPVQRNGGLDLFGGGNIQNTPFTQAGGSGSDSSGGLVGVNAPVQRNGFDLFGGGNIQNTPFTQAV